MTVCGEFSASTDINTALQQDERNFVIQIGTLDYRVGQDNSLFEYVSEYISYYHLFQLFVPVFLFYRYPEVIEGK